MSVENTHYGAVEIGKALAGCRGIFFIGIGGISMSALAAASLGEGYLVGGSDRGESELIEHLRGLGIRVFRGHDAAHLDGYDAVVYTVAISPDNPEYAEAKRRGLPVFSRADYLGYLMMRYRTRIGVAGMHGKSTCTAMCTGIFLRAGDPTVFCGAELPELNDRSCRAGESRETILFEACEYMDSFLDFSPTLAIILNIGLDHVDYFHSMEQIRSSFRKFAARAGEDGTVLINADDGECVRTFAEGAPGRIVRFGIREDADYTAKNIRSDDGKTSFDFFRGGYCLGTVRLGVFGLHNVYNALAAASAADLSGVPFETVAEGLGAFTGAHRRMERKGEMNGAVVYDDYGHHPDEIRATLAGAKKMGYRRILCAYQPHTYSRTAGLLEEFSRAFDDADRVFAVDVYAAREQNTFGVTSETLARRIGEKAVYTGGFAETAEAIRREARPGDLVIVMGAGDVFHVFEHLPLK